MLSERGLNNKINHLHEKALRIAFKDELSDFEALLKKDYAVMIHVKTLKLLMTKAFKTEHSLNSKYMKEIFDSKTTSMFLEMNILSSF